MNTGITVKLLGRACGCIRPSSCLVAGCTLVAGTLTGFRSPFQTGAAAAWREVLYFFSQFMCAATAAYCILWSVELLLRISEARLCAFCRCLRHCGWLRWCQGVRGYYVVQAVDLQGGNSRPPWKSPPGAAASMVLGSCTITVLTLTQMRRRHGAARIFEELWSWANAYGDAVVYDGCSSEVIGPMQI